MLCSNSLLQSLLEFWTVKKAFVFKHCFFKLFQFLNFRLQAVLCWLCFRSSLLKSGSEKKWTPYIENKGLACPPSSLLCSSWNLVAINAISSFDVDVQNKDIEFLPNHECKIFSWDTFICQHCFSPQIFPCIINWRRCFSHWVIHISVSFSWLYSQFPWLYPFLREGFISFIFNLWYFKPSSNKVAFHMFLFSWLWVG